MGAENMERPASHVEGDIHAAEIAHASVLSTQRAGVVESTEVQREKGCSVDLSSALSAIDVDTASSLDVQGISP